MSLFDFDDITTDKDGATIGAQSQAREKGIAEFECSGEFLRQALHLPADAVITHCRDKAGSWPGHPTLILRVESASLPRPKEGEPLPRCCPQYREHEGLIVMQSWGIS